MRKAIILIVLLLLAVTLNQGCRSLSSFIATPTPIPPSFKECYNNGLNLIKEKKYEEAVAYFNKALEIEPDNLQAWNSKGNALYSSSKYEESIKCYDKILGKDPNTTVIWCSKGNALAFLKKYNEALVCYEKALTIDPKNKDAKNNKQSALKVIKLLKNSKLSDGYFTQGYDLYMKNKYQEALQYFNKALKLNPKNEKAKDHKQYTLEILKTNKLEEQENNYVNRGNELSLSGQYNDAILNYESALKIDPNNAVAWLGKAYAYHSLGKYDVAIGCYTKVLELDPTNSDARKYAYEAQNEIDKAKYSSSSSSYNNSNNNSSYDTSYAESSQCLGTTKKGNRCKRKTTNSNGYCWQHQSQAQ